MKINRLPIDGNGNIAMQDIANSTINIINVPDEIKKFIEDLYLWLDKETKFINILVITTTKERLDSINEIETEIKELLKLQYATEPKDWKPYKDENSIINLICDFHTKSGFKIKAYFVDDFTIDSRELLTFLQEDFCKQTILIADGIALYHQNNSDFAKVFDKSEIGGCLFPICKNHPDRVKDLFFQSKFKTFTNIDDYYHNKFNRQYMNIELHIPTREDLFRRLTNIAVKHLNIPETFVRNPFVDRFKNQGINQQTASFQ